MSIEKKSGLFYELLIRGNFGAEHQPDTELGAFAGAHYIEGEAFVDTDTGEVIQYKPGPAQPLPQDKVVAFLGEKFVTFEASMRELQGKHDALIKQTDADLTAAQQQIKQLQSEKDDIAKERADLSDQLQKAHSDRDTLSEKLSTIAAAAVH